MNPRWRYLWAKTGESASVKWHPLVLHMLDVASAADAIMEREPESTRQRMASVLGLGWTEARPWLLLLIACHDLGKACPGFQAKWPEILPLSGALMPRMPNTDVQHAFVSQFVLETLLRDLGWPDELADLAADAVGCHHGSRARSNDRDDAEREVNVGRGAQCEAIRSDWVDGRRELFEALRQILDPHTTPTKQSLDGPDFMLLSGLTSFADWIGSNEEWFPFGSPEDCADLKSWFQKRRALADNAMHALGWEHRTPLSAAPLSFEEIFRFSPRPLQQAVAEILGNIQQPSVLLVEAPMGEGKTEAAFYTHLALQRRFGHRGLYVALPTKATGNAMFARTLEFLQSRGANRHLDLQLIHGGALLNDTFQNLKVSGIYDAERHGDVRAREWFTNKKRALLSEYGVGTVDQALLTILPVRHQFVRLWGLANRVVVFDEIHAYDAYTGTLLINLIRWLLALGSSVVLLSATLSPSFRRKLADVAGAKLPDPEATYPRLSVFSPGRASCQAHFEADLRRRLTVRLKGVAPDLVSLQSELAMALVGDGMALALVNTVQRAQDLYRLFADGEPLIQEGQRVGKRLSDGTEVFLFHARYPADQRQKREDRVMANFGPNADRVGRKILIATQVVEQSLDLDFDVIATDLAPIDLVLQRAGRLWRHERKFRPVRDPVLLVAGMTGDAPPSFERPLWWGMAYREDILLRTWSLLRTRPALFLPDDIDALVEAVYEEKVCLPDSVVDRHDKAVLVGDGKVIAHTSQAYQNIIGFPDDASWNDPGRFVMFDEDDTGIHLALRAQTRLDDDSALVIPLLPVDRFVATTLPDFAQSKAWFLRAIGVSRSGVVRRLKGMGKPEGWKKSVLLRNCFPLELAEDGRWTADASVRLDEDLGLVYETKETT